MDPARILPQSSQILDGFFSDSEESFFILQGILDLEKEGSIPSMILPGSFLDSFFFLPILLRFQKEGSIPTRIRLGSFLKSNAF